MKLSNIVAALITAIRSTAIASPTPRSTNVSGLYIPHHDDHWPAVDFKREYSKGARFVFIRVRLPISVVKADSVQGTDTKAGDIHFSQLWNAAKDEGIVRGAVHNIHPHINENATAQGEVFAAHHGKWVDDGYTLPGSLHLTHREGHRRCFGLSQDAMVEWIGNFAKAYQKKSTRYPTVFTTDAWWKNCTGNSEEFNTQYGLFIIHYAKTVGELPGGWSKQTFWQHGNGGVCGVLGDEFNGGEAALKAFAKGT